MSTDIKDWTVLSMLEWATDYFDKRNVPDPRLSIEWLLAETLNIKRLDLYLKFDRPLASAELETLRPLVKRRAAHEPLQYIIGHTDFMNAHIQVSQDVLIPRIETEQLVEIILDRHSAESVLSAFDIGTGSGCIPIALKMERPAWNIQALDISESALSVARKNAEENKTDISFHQGDITKWKALPGNPLDLIVSNPPYITPEEKEKLEPQVKNHEPAQALFCDDIEAMYSGIRTFAYENLNQKGQLYLEIHEDYSSSILSLFDSKKWNPSLLKDYEGKPRFIIASKLL